MVAATVFSVRKSDPTSIEPISLASQRGPLLV